MLYDKVETIDVVKIKSGREMEDFICLPYFMYKNCPQYVPDLVGDIRDLFDHRKNCDFHVFSATKLKVFP
jgi:hypothetical protein